MVAIFVSFFVRGYRATVNAKFISLQTNAGDCVPVTMPATGTFVGTIDGYWEGNPNFLPQRGIFSLDLVEFKTTNEEFRNIMQNIGVKLADAIRNISTRDAGLNLILWMQWQSIEYKNYYLFQLTPSPLSVLDREHLFFSIGSINGTCGVQPLRTYIDSSKFHIITEYYVSEYESDAACMNGVSPQDLSHTKYFEQMFSIFFDINSLMLCIGVLLNFLFTVYISKFLMILFLF